MKIVIPPVKPRAKWLNDILKSKKNSKHSSLLKPARNKEKQEFSKRCLDEIW